MRIKGKAHKYGADVNTDIIIPARFLNVSEPADWAKHCMEDIDTEFISRVENGDFIVATRNFGCGSSREEAPVVIKLSGISCVIASSFARIFFRNAINIGLPILECVEAAEATDMGDELEIELTTGEITNLTKGKKFCAKPLPEFMLEITAKGGLIEYAKERLRLKKSS